MTSRSRQADKAQQPEAAPAAPASKGVVGSSGFFDDFEGSGLSAERWQYTIQDQWPPGTSNRISVPPPGHVPRPYDFRLNGNTYIGVSESALVQYVNCSSWYDTIRARPIWTRPTEQDRPFYVMVWGVRITPLSLGFLRHPPGKGLVGFIFALSDEYEQSYFANRCNYLAVKGLQPLSRGFQPLPGGDPDPLEIMRVSTEFRFQGTVQDAGAFADSYVSVGAPVDVSWVVSREAVVARWKPSKETEWRGLQSESTERLKHLRLRFGGSWCEYLVDAVQVSDEDLVRKPPEENASS